MKRLLLLHGAIGAASELNLIEEQLKTYYKVYTINFTGHGGRPYTNAPFSIELFADDVLAFMQQERLEKISIFGYSMGGYVAMYLAKHYPEKIDKVITLATKYHWDETTAAKEIQLLNPDKIAEKLPAFAEGLRKMHMPNDWKEVLRKTAEMMIGLGSNNALKPTDYTQLSAPSLILLGDRDKMVSLEETVATYKALLFAQMGVLPNTPHPLAQVNVNALIYLIKDFLQ